MRIACVVVLAMLAATSHALEITGRVVNADGEPVHNARVSVESVMPAGRGGPFCPTCSPDIMKAADTDRDGRFVIESDEHDLRYRLLAMASGYEPALSRSHTGPKGINITLERKTPIDPSQTVIGRVVDPNGRPIAGAIVERIGRAREVKFTDRQGEFAWRVDRSGEVSVRVRARGYAPLLVFGLTPEREHMIRVAAGASLSGTITRDGEPLKNVVLSVLHLDRATSNHLGDDFAMTDDRGMFFIHALGVHANYRIVITAEDRDVTQGVLTGAGGSNRDLGTIEVP